jgi:hypothetical protein
MHTLDFGAFEVEKTGPWRWPKILSAMSTAWTLKSTNCENDYVLYFEMSLCRLLQKFEKSLWDVEVLYMSFDLFVCWQRRNVGWDPQIMKIECLTHCFQGNVSWNMEQIRMGPARLTRPWAKKKGEDTCICMVAILLKLISRDLKIFKVPKQEIVRSCS